MSQNTGRLTEEVRDNVTPGVRWEFDAEVTRVFEDMLRRSIPQYEAMREAVFFLACKFRQKGTAIVDLGCSRGDALAPLIDKYGVANQFVGVEVAKPMAEHAAKRFKGMIDVGIARIDNQDLRTFYPEVSASVTLSVLTLQFTPIEYRQQIVQRIYDHTAEGGALILVEKVLGDDALLNDVMVEEYYNMKRSNGYSQDEIDRKRLSLEGVLVPVTAKWNVELLRAAGFRRVDCFWRWFNFAGWVAVK